MAGSSGTAREVSVSACLTAEGARGRSPWAPSPGAEGVQKLRFALQHVARISKDWRLRVLLVLTVPPPRLEEVLSELQSRGHELHVVVDPEFADTEAVDRVLDRHPEITRDMVAKRQDGWVALAGSVGRSIEYLRFRSPPYAQAPKLRARAQRRAPKPVLRVAAWPVVRSRIGLRALRAALRRLERAIPPSPQIVELIRSWRPDLVIVSSMVKGTAHPGQGDYVRAARAMGI